MDVHNCIQTRRSVRKFTNQPVSEASLLRVLRAVQWAPSWVNYQPWEIVIVDDQGVKERLLECIHDSNPGKKAVGAAPVVLAMCGRLGKSGYMGTTATTEYGDWVMFDLGIASQNLCLAAWAEGLGSLHLGALDHQRAASVLGLPDDVKLYELIPIGYPQKESRAPNRRSIEDFTHKNRFS